MIIQEAPDYLPSRVILEITESCNYKCIHCFVPHRLRGLTTDQIVSIVDKIEAAAVPSVSWTGGEPYLRQDLFEIMSRIHKRSTIHTINTNGSLVDKDIARKTATHFRLARVSIYGTDSSFVRNTGGVTKFSPETSLNAIQLFLDAGLRIQVNVPVISPTIDELLPISKELDRRFGSALEEVVYIPVTLAGPVEFTSFTFPDSDAVENAISIISKQVSFPTRLFVWKPGKHMLIKADGLAYAHPIPGTIEGGLAIGSALDESIQDLWSKFPAEFIHAHRVLTPSVNHLSTR